MKIRNLRIVWSVLCCVPILILVALWVRSYWRIDGLSAIIRADTYMCISHEGIVELAWLTDHSTQYLPPTWDVSSSPTNAKTRRVSNLFARGFALTPESAVIPLWFPVMLTTVLASAPWYHWSNRFSLRALFFAMTLAAIALSLIVSAIK